MKYFDKDEKGQPFDIPNMYTVQCVKLDEHERSDLGGYVPGAISNNMPWANNQRSRNNKQLFTVSLRSEVDPPYAFLSSELRFCGVWWVFENKIKPLTGPHCKECFTCAGCRRRPGATQSIPPWAPSTNKQLFIVSFSCAEVLVEVRGRAAIRFSFELCFTDSLMLTHNSHMLLDESALQHPHALRSEKLSTNAVHTAWFNHLSSYCVGIGYRPPGRACLLFTAVLVAGSVARREVELWYRCNSDSSWRSHVLAAEVWEPAKEIPVAVAGGLIGHNAGIQTFYNLYLAHPVHLLSRLTPVVKLSSASTFPKCVSRFERFTNLRTLAGFAHQTSLNATARFQPDTEQRELAQKHITIAADTEPHA
ncbi:hypothetical protein LTR09_008448 [Extremus antarcticus]|uniref:Uncharacterized protein n=1 Tax=Extremus antarcticus TaxID=702011 RepID=A0AAJ0DAT6_9PEZI|nr:hypothetical protein LTR09_008448 [Extremus antarcticus]